MVVSMKVVVFWVVPYSMVEDYQRLGGAFNIRAKMQAASTSETLVNFYQTTRCNNPEDSHLVRDIVYESTILFLGKLGSSFNLYWPYSTAYIWCSL
jgi:hypothetical protein